MGSQVLSCTPIATSAQRLFLNPSPTPDGKQTTRRTSIISQEQGGYCIQQSAVHEDKYTFAIPSLHHLQISRKKQAAFRTKVDAGEAGCHIGTISAYR
jgi:hypothetical protein